MLGSKVDLLKQLNALRFKKATAVERLAVLDRTCKFVGVQQQKHQLSKSAALPVQKESNALLGELGELKDRIASLKGECSSALSMCISPAWLVCMLRALATDRLARLSSYFTAQNKMGLARALDTLVTSGVLCPSLLPFLWPCAGRGREASGGGNQGRSVESKQYWQMVRASVEGKALWPTDFVPIDLDDAAEVNRLMSLLDSLNVMRSQGDDLVLQVPCSASTKLNRSGRGVSASAVSHEAHSHRLHLVYTALPQTFFSSLIYSARKSYAQVEYSASPYVATFQHEVSVSLLNAKVPESVIPRIEVAGAHKSLSGNKFKSDEIQRALVSKVGSQIQAEDAIERVFKRFQKTDDEDLGGLELDREEVEQGLKSIGVRVSKADVDTFFESADKDGGGTIDCHEFKLLIRSLLRASQYSKLRPDQMHIIIQCLSAAQRNEFVALVADVESTYPGLVRLATLDAGAAAGEQEASKQVALCYSPDSQQHLFTIEKRDGSLILVDCQDCVADVFGWSNLRDLNGTELLHALHPRIAAEVERHAEEMAVESLSGLRLVRESQMQLKPSIGGDSEAEDLDIVTRGWLARRSTVPGRAAGRVGWRCLQWLLTATGEMMRYNTEVGRWESFLNVLGCRVSRLPESEHKHAFELKFSDGRYTIFSAPCGEDGHWLASLESVGKRSLVPVQLVTAGPGLIRVETGPVCLIKRHLLCNAVSFIDRTEAPLRKRESDIEEPERALQYRKSSCPRVAICVIDGAYFHDADCLTDFESYTSGLLGNVSLIPVLVPGFAFPVRDQIWPWWPHKKRRWRSWESHPLFVDLRSTEQGQDRQESTIRSLLIPSLRCLLDNGLGQSLAARADDEITCRGCARIGLTCPMRVRRSALEAHLLQWQKEEMKRRVMGTTEMEPPFPCAYCGGGSTASQLLMAGVSRHLIPCPSCVANGLFPPFSFDRLECLRRLQTEEGHADKMRCVKEDTEIRLIDVIVPNCFVSYPEQMPVYADEARALVQALMREDNRILPWPPKAVACPQSARHGIRRSSAVILLLSDHYFSSPDCARALAAAIEFEVLLVPLIVEPFAFFAGRAVEALEEADGRQQWYPNDSQSEASASGLVTHWSFLRNLDPIDFRTPQARAACLPHILDRVSASLSLEDGKQERAQVSAQWRAGLSHAQLEAIGQGDADLHIPAVFSRLDTDGSGCLDISELSTAMKLLGLETDGKTSMSSLMAEVRCASGACIRTPHPAPHSCSPQTLSFLPHLACVSTMSRQADVDGDGTVSRREFEALFRAIFDMSHEFLLSCNGTDARVVPLALLKRAAALASKSFGDF